MASQVSSRTVSYEVSFTRSGDDFRHAISSSSSTKNLEAQDPLRNFQRTLVNRLEEIVKGIFLYTITGDDVEGETESRDDQQIAKLVVETELGNAIKEVFQTFQNRMKGADDAKYVSIQSGIVSAFREYAKRHADVVLLVETAKDLSESEEEVDSPVENTGILESRSVRFPCNISFPFAPLSSILQSDDMKKWILTPISDPQDINFVNQLMAHLDSDFGQKRFHLIQRAGPPPTNKSELVAQLIQMQLSSETQIFLSQNLHMQFYDHYVNHCLMVLVDAAEVSYPTKKARGPRIRLLRRKTEEPSKLPSDPQ